MHVEFLKHIEIIDKGRGKINDLRDSAENIITVLERDIQHPENRK
jgi:hypothetical protein